MIKKTEKSRSYKAICMLALALLLTPNIYFIADKLGITLAPAWYKEIVDWVAAGGTLGGAFAAIVGITVPGWILTAAAAFGITLA